MRLMGMELGPGRIPDDPQALGDAQPAIARERGSPRRVDAVVLETKLFERERAPDREEDRVALGGRAVVEVDDVAAAGTDAGMGTDGPDAPSGR